MFSFRYTIVADSVTLVTRSENDFETIDKPSLEVVDNFKVFLSRLAKNHEQT